MKLIRAIAALAVFAAAVEAQAAGHNLVTNGDFETGDLTGWQHDNGWAVESPSPFSGNYDVETGYEQGAVLSQEIPLTTGKAYLLSFDYAGGAIPYTAGVTASVGDSSSNITSLFGTHAFNQGFIANGQNTLHLVNDSVGAFSHVDNVSVTQLSAYDIFAGAVTVVAGGPTIYATFEPKFGMTLQQLASLLGYSNFNWQQTLIGGDAGVLPTIVASTLHTPPFLDPIKGGYLYNLGDDAYPYYFDQSNSFRVPWYNLSSHINADDTTLGFSDAPSIPCLPGFASFDLCNTYFTTDLVGVNADGSLGSKLFEFTWKSNFSMFDQDGGTARLSNYYTGPGTGGVTLLSQRYFNQGVPEPSTWEMMLLGFGAIGFAMRRKCRQLALA